MKLVKKYIFAAILASASGYAVSETLDTSDIENFDTVWVKGYEQGKTEELMKLYTETAVVFPPSSEILQGRTAIQAYLDGIRAAGFKEYSISNVDTNIKGSTIYESALWEAKRLDAEGNEIVLDGNISNVYEKQNDGSWKIKFQSWN